MSEKPPTAAIRDDSGTPEFSIRIWHMFLEKAVLILLISWVVFIQTVYLIIATHIIFHSFESDVLRTQTLGSGHLSILRWQTNQNTITFCVSVSESLLHLIITLLTFFAVLNEHWVVVLNPELNYRHKSLSCRLLFSDILMTSNFALLLSLTLWLLSETTEYRHMQNMSHQPIIL